MLKKQRSFTVAIPTAAVVLVMLGIGLDATAHDSLFRQSQQVFGFSAAAPVTRLEYAQMCALEMGTLPDLNCLDGEVITVTSKLDGSVATTQLDDCERPAYFNGVSLSAIQEKGCVPGGRLGRIVSADHPNVTTMYICRKYNSQVKPEEFHDVAIIQHNRDTGHTCWYQSTFGTPLPGTNVPSPMSASDVAARTWLELNAATGQDGINQINCLRCHDSDPFVWTPYVGQVIGLTSLTSSSPGDRWQWVPNGTYVPNVPRVFTATEPAIIKPIEIEVTVTPAVNAARGSETIVTVPNQCTVCHRFATNTCRREGAPGLSLMHDSIIGTESSTVFKYALAPWMPNISAYFSSSISPTLEEWHTKYDASIKQLEDCCNNPDQPFCNKVSLAATAEPTITPTVTSTVQPTITPTVTSTVQPTITPTITSTATDSPGTTVIELSSFVATIGKTGTLIQWTTGFESNTWGFHIYRAEQSTWPSATRVTASLIPARGSSSSTSYSWFDSQMTAGNKAYYWLEEVELTGKTHRYGPFVGISADLFQKVFVPITHN